MPRIVRFHQTGGPEVLQIEDLASRQPGPEEVRIRVTALGLNRAETMFRAGNYLEPAVLPSRIGYEAAGVVDAIGDGVEGLQLGDPVSVVPAFSMTEYGVYGEEAVVPARALVKMPPDSSPIEAAALWMQYLTAYGALIDIGELDADDTVLIPAASSSVGIAAIQIARMMGATPIAATRTEEKKQALLDLGAAAVIVTEQEDLTEQVRRLTDGAGVRIVFDPVAGPYVENLATITAPGGIIFLYGALSLKATPFPLFKALANGLTLRGYTLFEITLDDDRLARGIDFVVRGRMTGALTPVIARTFPFDQIVEAHQFMESNEQIGKIVVTV
jgi:NADPH:quinone reductase and related Zn-dependent oxidoreductases